MLRVGEDGGLELADRSGTGGSFPISVTASGNTIYVLNAGAPASISGFRLDAAGHLSALPNSTRLLGAGAFGQVAFHPNGRALIVTDKANSRLLVLRIDGEGLPEQTAVESASAGMVPFGVAFDAVGHVLVVEAGSNAVSSYRLMDDGHLQTLAASVADGQKASCWITVNARGQVITANPGTQTLSSFQVRPANGQLSLQNGAAGAGNRPLDIDVARNGRYVYAVDPAVGGVDMYRIEQDGSLSGMGSVDAGLGLFAQGMAVR